jgi:hypothetical protein
MKPTPLPKGVVRAQSMKTGRRKLSRKKVVRYAGPTTGQPPYRSESDISSSISP